MPAAQRALPVGPLGIVNPPPIQVEAPAFTGSLAMLFEVVRDRKLDLREVPLAPICAAYLRFLIEQENPPLDEAAAALMALSYLLERKSWLLLPTPDPEPEEDDPLFLPEPTAHEYALVIETLRIYQEERERLYFRPLDQGPNPYEVPAVMDSISPSDLARAFERVLRRAVPTPLEPLSAPRRSLAETIDRVWDSLDDTLRPLEELLPAVFTREDAVYYFLALLELIRTGHTRVVVVGWDVRFARVKSEP